MIKLSITVDEGEPHELRRQTWSRTVDWAGLPLQGEFVWFVSRGEQFTAQVMGRTFGLKEIEVIATMINQGGEFDKVTEGLRRNNFKYSGVNGGE